MTGACVICGREETLTRHHNKRNKREFERPALRQVVGVCRPCHSQIHQLLTEKELEREFNTVFRLRVHPEIAKFADWIRAKPRGFKAAMRTARALRAVRRQA